MEVFSFFHGLNLFRVLEMYITLYLCFRPHRKIVVLFELEITLKSRT